MNFAGDIRFDVSMAAEWVPLFWILALWSLVATDDVSEIPYMASKMEKAVFQNVGNYLHNTVSQPRTSYRMMNRGDVLFTSLFNQTY